MIQASISCQQFGDDIISPQPPASLKGAGASALIEPDFPWPPAVLTGFMGLKGSWPEPESALPNST